MPEMGFTLRTDEAPDEPASGRFVASPALNDLGGQAARQTVNGFCAKKAVAGPNTNRLGDWLAGSAARMRE